MWSLVQPADLLIMVSDKPLMRALLVDDDLVKCEVKTVMPLPAFFIVSIHHRPTVVGFTASCGASILTNNCFDFLTVPVFVFFK